MRRSILVTGGTGTLGRELVHRLVRQGHDVRVASRREPPEDGPAGYAWRTVDLSTGEGLEHAVDRVDTIVHCAHDHRDDTAVAEKLVTAACAAGEPYLIYISIVGIDRVPLGYYRGKLATERLIEESGLPWTILRASQFHDLVLQGLTWLAKLPIVPVPARCDFQPIDVRVVADRLAELAAGDPALPAGRVPDMAGPQVRTARDLARAYLRARGLRRLVVDVPLPGAVARGLRHGGNLAPDHAAGGTTFEEFLAERVSSVRRQEKSGTPRR